MRKLILALLVLPLAGMAHASFELMMALDRTDKVVHRYDSETGTYLGSFGAGYIQNPLGMVIDQSTNTAFILQDRPSGSDYITRLNYNTGAFLGTFVVGPFATDGFGRLNDGRYVASLVGTDVSLLNSTGGGEAGWVSVPSGANAGNYSGMAQDIHGTLYAQNSNGVIYGWANPFSGGNGALPNASLGASSPLQARGQLATRGNWLASGNLSALIFARTAAGGGFSLTSGVTTIYSDVRGVAIGHENMMYAAGQTGAASGSISRYDQFGNFAGSFGAAQLKDPIALSVVVAPEPGTLLALGAGMAFFLRKRRQTKG